jgi:translation elongation factor EF-4
MSIHAFFQTGSLQNLFCGVRVRMKRFGKVDIPAEAFTVMLKRD